MNTNFVLHPLSNDEEQTYEHFFSKCPGAQIVILPTHHMTEYGDLSGFMFQCESTNTGSCLPISRTMFFGHTLVECEADEEVIWNLITQKEKNKEIMESFLNNIKREYVPAHLGCIPENSGYMELYGLDHETLTQDSQHWEPEVPQSIGIYHAMIRGLDREVRTHKLYLICSGGLIKAADEFCNLIIDIGTETDAGTIADSEEVWWLKKASTRARCQLLYQLAQFFDLEVLSVRDIQSKKETMMVIPTADCFEHDIVYNERRHKVRVLNGCCDTTRSIPGAIVKMHPTEGFWWFRSSEKDGILNTTGIFPCVQPNLHKSNKYTYQVMEGSEKVVCLEDNINYQNKSQANWLCFDEKYFRVLQEMGWDRNKGFIEMIPIIVGVSLKNTN